MVSNSRSKQYVAALKADLRHFQQKSETAQTECAAAEARNRDLERELEALRGKLAAALQEVDLAPELLARLLRGVETVEDVLHVAVIRARGRLRALPTAYDSARNAPQLKPSQRAQLARDLLDLADSYRDCLMQGGGDSCGIQVFGSKRFAATESKTTRSNRRAIAARTFQDDGQPRLMLRHLKYGLLRVHFGWDDADACVVIGHCGGHLPLR